ncbi:MAG: hypothetical protein PF569_08630, partial [Candidatus Woesearchaeota archaeon]|nr:hypothetical protein [Candidatus Woesearchaeota archaeon]
MSLYYDVEQVDSIIVELMDTISVNSYNIDSLWDREEIDPFLTTQNTFTKEPTGFLSPSNVILNYNSTTRTITLTGTT